MDDRDGKLLVGEVWLLLHGLRQYVRLRWLAVGTVLIGMLVARSVLNVGVPLFPVLSITTVIALYNALFSIWQQRPHTPTLSWGRRFAFAQVVADLVALTALLHFAGGVETPFFLFYLFHVGFGSIMLSRRDAYVLMVLAIGLFVLLVGTELLGWLPHMHLEGFVSPDLYRERAYVIAVVASFAATLVILTAGLTAIMTELRRQWAQQATARERELEEIGERLVDLDRMRTFFLGLASHDLKTPLAAVTNYLQAILDGFVGEVNVKQRWWMERANLRILELIRLINDFLDVSQLDPARVLTEAEPTPLGDVVKLSIEEVHVKAEEKSVALRMNLPPHLPMVHVAPRRLQQVITNLLDNAIMYSPRHGEVTLAAHQQPDEIQVNVVDAGPCIPSIFMPHIFDDYFQVQRKEFVPGASLGLCTARKIVEAHGGRIWVQSPCFADGNGSCFSFTLPTRRQDTGGQEE